MTTDAHPGSSHEERLRALEERLLALVDDLHQLREDMAAGDGGPTDHDDTSSS